MKNQKAVVVFSGGQDSTTCLGIAIKAHGPENVFAVAFDYGQKHKIELQMAAKIAELKGVRLQIVKVPALSLMKSSALVNGGDVGADHAYLEGLPASFVPARNALFLTAAYGLAMEYGAENIYTGVCQTDYSGYPDCRLEFIEALNHALDVGYQRKIKILTPLMQLTKAETFALAAEVGIIGTVLQYSHTCYNGDHITSNAWGYGCGTCPACELRKNGYEKYISSRREAEADAV